MVRKHPIQNVTKDARGVYRFQQNTIVRFLLDQYKPNLNDLYVKFAESDPEDYEQLMQLIGYSLSGFGELCDSIFGETKPCQYRTLAAAERKKIRNGVQKVI